MDKAVINHFTFIVSMMHQLSAHVGVPETGPVHAALLMGVKDEKGYDE